MSENCSHKNGATCSTIKVDEMADPDCLRCMRRKLQAVSVGVFFREGTSWRLDRFEGDKPYEAAEVEFQYMLNAGVPDAILAQGKSFCLIDDAAIERVFPKAAKLFLGHCVIAAPVQSGKSFGVRIAWRDRADPFSEDDVRTIQCEGKSC